MPSSQNLANVRPNGGHERETVLIYCFRCGHEEAVHQIEQNLVYYDVVKRVRVEVAINDRDCEQCQSQAQTLNQSQSQIGEEQTQQQQQSEYDPEHDPELLIQPMNEANEANEANEPRQNTHALGFPELENLEHQDWLASETTESLQTFNDQMNALERDGEHDDQHPDYEDPASYEIMEGMELDENLFDPEHMDVFDGDEHGTFDAEAGDEFIRKGYEDDFGAWVDYDTWTGNVPENSHRP
ncbi:hypothetical protein B0A52_02629 [Exophiala mesophila]|uniref:Uncharacterized protein n=1 Tax=Exophiala mesophila TaxID=212818 RepID=A0A438NDM7_EXOME|nr:hypothetical protein B0A52_02629 [Exophiala mesophila]